eukprot:11137570-Alexandrium_andersonii.AAC.1
MRVATQALGRPVRAMGQRTSSSTWCEVERLGQAAPLMRVATQALGRPVHAMGQWTSPSTRCEVERLGQKAV